MFMQQLDVLLAHMDGMATFAIESTLASEQVSACKWGVNDDTYGCVMCKSTLIFVVVPLRKTCTLHVHPGRSMVVRYDAKETLVVDVSLRVYIYVFLYVCMYLPRILRCF
jgi:hypothetical protein